METMPSFLLFILFLGVSLANNFILSMLASLHTPSYQSMVCRGIACFACSIVGGFLLKEKLIPKFPKEQMVRFGLAGAGLWAIIESYAHAKASEIALVSRFDVPLIIVFGFLIKMKVTRLQKTFALFVMGIIIISLKYFASESTSVFGLSLALIGTVFLGASYLLLGRTATSESGTIVSATPALACIVFGAGLSFFSNAQMNLTITATLLSFLSGVTMYLAYRICRHLYRRYTFLRAQMAYVLIPTLSIPMDIIYFNHSFSFGEYILFAAISAAIVSLCFIGEKKVDVKTSAMEKDDVCSKAIA